MLEFFQEKYGPCTLKTSIGPKQKKDKPAPDMFKGVILEFENKVDAYKALLHLNDGQIRIKGWPVKTGTLHPNFVQILAENYEHNICITLAEGATESFSLDILTIYNSLITRGYSNIISAKI